MFTTLDTIIFDQQILDYQQTIVPTETPLNILSTNVVLKTKGKILIRIKTEY